MIWNFRLGNTFYSESRHLGESNGLGCEVSKARVSLGLLEILERVGPVAYRLALPPNLDRVHNIFHVSMLWKYLSDPSHVLDHYAIELREDSSYEEAPARILAWEDKKLRNRVISLREGAVE